MDTAEFELIDSAWDECQHACAAIRRQVFIIEQGVPEEEEWDNQDECATHFLAYAVHPRKAVACARLMALPAPTTPTNTTPTKTMKVTRMAVLAPYRGKGLGSALLQRMIKLAQESGGRYVALDAQLHAQSFYAKAGFEATGSPFMDAGIKHIKMIREL